LLKPDYQEGEDGHVRVSNNFSDGKELLELDDVKRRVEKMERDFHASDILHKPNRAKLESQLNDLRDRVKKLSQKLVSDPQKDLA
jgi:phage shock protein A